MYSGTFKAGTSINSVDLWFRTRVKGVQTLIRKVNKKNNNALVVKLDTKGVTLEIPGRSAKKSLHGTPYWDGKWHHVIARVNATDDYLSYDLVSATGKWISASVDDGFSVIVLGNSFDGCMKDVRVAGFLLPVFSESELRNDTSAEKFNLSASTPNAKGEHFKIGCHGKPVCDDNECVHGSTCKDIWNKYTCTCPVGYEGDRCQTNINDCVKHNCTHGTCRDGVARFYCDCNRGYKGEW